MTTSTCDLQPLLETMITFYPTLVSLVTPLKTPNNFAAAITTIVTVPSFHIILYIYNLD